MIESELAVPTSDGVMTTFTAHPDGGGPFPLAFLYMDALGYREQLKANARRFAAGGFYCAAPDLFYRSGDRLSFNVAAGGGPEVMEKVMKLVAETTPERVAADTRAVLSALAADPAADAGPKVCVGYCMGARIALGVAAALPDQFVATAGIHPGALFTDRPDSPHHDLGRVRGELYISFSEIDRSATPDSVDAFRAEMDKQGVRGEVERVPGVGHGFAMADHPAFDQAAAERHFERTLELWRRNLPQREAV